jgi:hypothetical protein
MSPRLPQDDGKIIEVHVPPYSISENEISPTAKVKSATSRPSESVPKIFLSIFIKKNYSIFTVIASP